MVAEFKDVLGQALTTGSWILYSRIIPEQGAKSELRIARVDSTNDGKMLVSGFECMSPDWTLFRLCRSSAVQPQKCVRITEEQVPAPLLKSFKRR
jgi:hypothetical protein